MTIGIKKMDKNEKIMYSYDTPIHPSLRKYQIINNAENVEIIKITIKVVYGPKKVQEPVSMPPGKLTFIP